MLQAHFSNLPLIRDTLDLMDRTNEAGILVMLDQEGAFDRLDHEYLARTLAQFRFRPFFLSLGHYILLV